MNQKERKPSKRTHCVGRKFWSSEDLHQAEKLAEAGKTCAEIGLKLGRSEDAIRGKLKMISSAKARNASRDRIPCLKCLKLFVSLDKKRIRFCNSCKQQNRECYDNTAEIGNFHL